MAVTITKPKPKAVTPVVEEESTVSLADPGLLSLEQLADLYGSLTDQVTAIQANPVFAKLSLVTQTLHERLAADFEPKDKLKIIGNKWVLDIGAAARNPAKLKDVPLLQTFLGLETFLKLAKVNLGDILKYCTPDQVDMVVEKDTGYSNRRSVVASYKGTD